MPCTKRHTAQTFAVGTFPPPSPRKGMRSAGAGGLRLRPLPPAVPAVPRRATRAWCCARRSPGRGSARPRRPGRPAGTWRCDVVGGGEQSKGFVALPTTAKGLLLGKPDDRWLVCVDGPTVSGSVKIPCSTAAHLARGHHDRARQGRRRLPRRPALRGPHPRLLLRLGGRLAELPGRLRLRLHLVPRGGVEGRQPPLDLLGEDRRSEPCSARTWCSLVAGRCCWPAARRLPVRLRRPTSPRSSSASAVDRRRRQRRVEHRRYRRGAAAGRLLPAHARAS